jgi:hypothetical protein
MHSWRHFFNTALVMANVGGAKIREVVGAKHHRRLLKSKKAV